MSAWEFDLNVPQQKILLQEDPMVYVLTFGKFKGQMLGQIMHTSEGRKYLKWLQMQPCSDPEFQPAHTKRSERIDHCFQVFDAYVLQAQTVDK